MFMGPLRETKTWSTRSVDGVYRFLGRTWRLFEAHRGASSEVLPTAEQLRVLHTAIKKVTGVCYDNGKRKGMLTLRRGHGGNAV